MDLSAVVGATRFAQGLAACLVGRECGEMIIGGPARELGPFDRLELAVREFQRPFGRCASAREAHNRADEARDHAALQGLRKPPTSLHANKCTSDGNGSGARANVAREW
jgi:hypothetical protein